MTNSLALALLAVQAAPGGGFGALAPFLFQVVAIFAIFYFLMIRPQQRQRKQHEDRLRTLRKGDEIVTQGGIIGSVVHISEGTKDGQPSATMDDRVTIKSAESRLVVERGKIARVLTAEASTPTNTPASSQPAAK
jgi:preprotein translocase subunit YajC